MKQTALLASLIYIGLVQGEKRKAAAIHADSLGGGGLTPAPPPKGSYLLFPHLEDWPLGKAFKPNDYSRSK